MSRAQKEAARQFPVGGKVRLSVGGPVMVVAGATEAGKVVCRWFDGNRLEEAKFAPETLVAGDVPVEVSPQSPAAVNGAGGEPRPPAARRLRGRRTKAAPPNVPGRPD